MYRVVFDPGVLIAALISSKGAPRGLILRWFEGAFELLISPNVLAELRHVLERPKFRRYVSEGEGRYYLAFLQRFATVCPDPETVLKQSPDPGDDYPLALAVTETADFLVSGDPDLYELTGTTPPVITPRAFLTRLG